MHRKVFCVHPRQFRGSSRFQHLRDKHRHCYSISEYCWTRYQCVNTHPFVSTYYNELQLQNNVHCQSVAICILKDIGLTFIILCMPFLLHFVPILLLWFTSWLAHGTSSVPVSPIVIYHFCLFSLPSRHPPHHPHSLFITWVCVYPNTFKVCAFS